MSRFRTGALRGERRLWRLFRWQVPLEIHRRVKNPDDLEHFAFDVEKDHMSSLGGDPAAGKQVISLPPTVWRREDLLKLRPKRVQIGSLLLFTTSRQGVGANRTEIRHRDGGEIERHAGRRAKARNSSFEVMVTVSPA